MVIKISNLSYIYNVKGIKNHALQNISITFPGKNFVAIMGKSGMGKSTLINCIAGLLQPATGSILVDQFEIAGANERQLNRYRLETIGLVFQDFNLVDFLTIEENIALPMTLAKKSKSEQKSRVDWLLKKFDIIQYKKRYPDQLSIGEQQRVGICVALANDPPILLADEPTGSLDIENSRIIYEYFREINKEEGKTILMVSHDQGCKKYVDDTYELDRTSIKKVSS